MQNEKPPKKKCNTLDEICEMKCMTTNEKLNVKFHQWVIEISKTSSNLPMNEIRRETQI